MISGVTRCGLMLLLVVSRIDTKENMKFDLCRPLNPLSARQKAELKVLVRVFVKDCAFGVLNKNKHTLSKDVLLMLPSLVKKTCLFYLPLYNYFAEKPNCLPPSVARNATVVFELALKIQEVVLRDTSRVVWCQGTRCVKKQDIVGMSADWLRCLHDSYKGMLLSCADEMQWAATSMLKLLVRSGILKYYIG